MANVRKAKFKLLYNNVDITSDITKYGTSISYSDNDEGESDSIEITLEDVDALWRNSWYPEKGANLSLSIGYDSDDVLVDCGTFQVDEITLSGPPDVVSIKGIAAVVTKSLRTKRSKSFENQTLRQIAAYIASKHNLTLQGDIANVRFERVTQYRERDLSFLRRISIEYGYLFSVRDKKLIFTSVFGIEAANPVTSLDRTDIRGYSLKDKTSETYKAATVRYHNPNNNAVSKATVTTETNKDGVTYKKISTDDTIAIQSKAETPAQADLKATAALHHTNSLQQEGTLTLEGNPILVAGNNILVTGFGTISGKYYIRKSSHRIDKSGGYTGTIDIKRTQETQPVNQTPKQTEKKKTPKVVNNTNQDNVTFKTILVD